MTAFLCSRAVNDMILSLVINTIEITFPIIVLRQPWSTDFIAFMYPCLSGIWSCCPALSQRRRYCKLAAMDNSIWAVGKQIYYFGVVRI